MLNPLVEKPNAETVSRAGSAGVTLNGHYSPPPKDKDGKIWVRTSALVQSSPEELYKAWRNVELPMIYAGLSRDVRKAKAIEALRRVGLGDRVNHRPGELSGGQQQRVAVARALVGDPALVLADEPTGNLDSTATDDALGLFDELHEQGRTIVLITHELDVAQRARRIVRVRDGVITSDSADPDAGRHLAHAGAHEAGRTR